MRELTRAEFAIQLQRHAREPLAETCVAALYKHYQLLLHWNEKISLVGPGTLESLVESHYGEALAALPLLPFGTGGTLVDVGSGAGFPGIVLAAARPRLRTVLVEARERKWAFLKNAVALSGIQAECILGTVDRSLPTGLPPRVDWLTLRALKLHDRAWRALASRLAKEGRVLVWAGREDPPIPADVLRVARTLPLAGSHSKRIVELEPI